VAPLRDPGSVDAVPKSERDALADPYFGKKPPPPPKAPIAPAALTAFLLSWLPIGSIAAIPIGVLGLRQTRSRGVRGRGLAIAALSLGTLASLGYGAAGVYAGVSYVDDARREARSEEVRRERRVRERTGDEDPGQVTQAPLVERVVPRPEAPKNGTVPKDTRTTDRGKVAVVEIGTNEKSLRDALLREIGRAKADRKQVMVMVSGAGCKPCAGVLASLDDPRMQDALEATRLVIVDEVFSDDLDALKIPHEAYPSFALLAADATPRDVIDGGEWGDDVAANIAPVLGPFVRGDYKQRKKTWKPAPGGGIFL
jgi:hypothetical protein